MKTGDNIPFWDRRVVMKRVTLFCLIGVLALFTTLPAVASGGGADPFGNPTPTPPPAPATTSATEGGLKETPALDPNGGKTRSCIGPSRALRCVPEPAVKIRFNGFVRFVRGWFSV
jgi:hypothetical protein